VISRPVDHADLSSTTSSTTKQQLKQLQHGDATGFGRELDRDAAPRWTERVISAYCRQGGIPLSVKKQSFGILLYQLFGDTLPVVHS